MLALPAAFIRHPANAGLVGAVFEGAAAMPLYAIGGACMTPLVRAAARARALKTLDGPVRVARSAGLLVLAVGAVNVYLGARSSAVGVQVVLGAGAWVWAQQRVKRCVVWIERASRGQEDDQSIIMRADGEFAAHLPVVELEGAEALRVGGPFPFAIADGGAGAPGLVVAAQSLPAAHKDESGVQGEESERAARVLQVSAVVLVMVIGVPCLALGVWALWVLSHMGIAH